MSDFKVVGRSVPRKDGADKVTGRAVFLADYPIPGCWVAGTVKSPVARGILKGIRRDPAFDWSKVILLTAADLPGKNFVHMVRDDFPILAEGTVNFATQAVALIAAPDEETLREALAHAAAEVEPLKPVLSIEDSLTGEIAVWGEDNLIDEYRIDSGDLERGFAEADLIVEETYRTGFHEQLYLETQGVAAIPHPDGSLDILGSMQCPYYVQGALVQSLGLPPEKLRVRQMATGGGFGGKEDYPSAMALWVASLALKSGHPVRLIYDRSEDLLTTPKRHPSRTRVRAGAKNDGTLTALEIDLIFDGGAYTTLSRVVQQRGTLHCQGAYRTANVSIRSRTMATNTVPCGAYRGFGAPQGLFAMERHLDRIARELGLDPLDVRLKNIVRPGDSFPCGQLLTDGIHAEEVLLKAAEISDYRRKRAEYAKDAGRIRRGIGLTVAMHGGGFTGSGEADMGTRVRLEYRGGEGFLVHASSAEMGQGSATVLPMVAAEALGIPAARVKAPAPDTAITPNSGPTVASRTTMYVGRVVKETCNNLIAHLRDFLARAEGCPVEEILFSEGRFTRGSRGWSTEEAARACLDAEGILDAWGTLPAGCAGNWDPEAFRGEAYKGYAWIAQAVEVEVDLDTYEVEAKRAVLAAEIGRAIHPVMVEGQLAGGFLQGLGWSHIEDLTVTPEGRYSAEHLNAYLIPTTLDTPEWDITILEHPCEVGPYGAKGIGELPMDGVTPAFVSAVENATGAVGTEVPLTGEKLFRLLEGK